MNDNKIFLGTMVLALVALLFSCKQEAPLYQQTTDATDQVWLSIQRAANGTKGLTIFPIEEDERTETYSELRWFGTASIEYSGELCCGSGGV